MFHILAFMYFEICAVVDLHLLVGSLLSISRVKNEKHPDYFEVCARLKTKIVIATQKVYPRGFIEWSHCKILLTDSKVKMILNVHIITKIYEGDSLMLHCS